MDETLTATNNDRNRVFTDNPTENLARFGTTGVGGPNVDRTQGLTDAQLRVIRQQQTQPVTAPSPFTVNLADVPDSALGSLTRTDVLNARRGAETQAQTMLAEQNALQNRILEAIRPTETETQLQARLRESSQAEEAGVLGATERALGTTRVARAVQGEQALITQQEQARRRVLADELNALVNQRAVQVDALTQALEFSQENLAGLQTLQQLTKPDVLSTQVDATTGQIIATVQDPNGNVRTEVIGSVTPEVKEKTLRNTGTFTDEQGNLVFFGIDETGQIIKQVVGKEQVDPRQALDLQIKQAQLRGIQLENEERAFTGGEAGVDPVVSNIFSNPQVWHDLSASEKEKYRPILAQAGFNFPKKLTAAQLEVQNNANSALLAISNFENLAVPDGDVSRLGLVFSKSGLGRIANSRQEIVDVIARARTGAVISESEERFYNRMVPGALDSASNAKQKLNQLKMLFAGLAGTPVVIQSPEGDLYEYNDLYNSDQRLEVRNALESGYSIIES